MHTKHFSLNTKGTDYFVGDLHGCYDKFKSTLVDVNFDIKKDRVFSVGDLIDRGPDSQKCLELLDERWFHCVLGNHECFMLGIYAQDWFRNGGDWIGKTPQSILNSDIKLVKEKCYQTLTVDTQYGKIGIVHAESENDWNYNNEFTLELNTWSRSRFRYGYRNLIENIDLVIVGHQPMKEIVLLGNVLNIDTGAVYEDRGGFLTLINAKQAFDFLSAK